LEDRLDAIQEIIESSIFENINPCTVKNSTSIPSSFNVFSIIEKVGLLLMAVFAIDYCCNPVKREIKLLEAELKYIGNRLYQIKEALKDSTNIKEQNCLKEEFNKLGARNKEIYERLLVLEKHN
jgi:hypothetical protein